MTDNKNKGTQNSHLRTQHNKELETGKTTEAKNKTITYAKNASR